MLYIFSRFIKRLPREKFKSISASVLSLALVFLISIMYGVREQQNAELEDVIDNFEVRVEVSDPVNRATEGLVVFEQYIKMFIDEDATPTLAKFLRDTELRREFMIHGVPEVEAFIISRDEWMEEYTYLYSLEPTLDPVTLEVILGKMPPYPEPPVPVGVLNAITSVADIGAEGAFIDFFEGYDEAMFRTSEHVAVVSDEIYRNLDSENPLLTFAVSSEHVVAEKEVFAEIELRVVGTVYGTDSIFAPFWAINKQWEDATGLRAISNIMYAFMSDNRQIDEFKVVAREHFVGAGVVNQKKPFALTVFDGRYNELVGNLRQNISLIDVATPFVFALSACIGFVTSFLLTRRRQHEFAVMRSLGVRKSHVFLGALAEQFALCAIGSTAGCLLYLAVRGELMPLPAVIFTVCYTVGTIISAARAAGTDVLKILRDKD